MKSDTPTRKQWNYHYTDGRSIIRIRCFRQPSFDSVPSSGTWVVQELHSLGDRWLMPPAPEVTWGTLRELLYLGRTQAENAQ